MDHKQILDLLESKENFFGEPVLGPIGGTSLSPTQYVSFSSESQMN